MVELPAFDTGQYEGSDFSMSGGDASLTIHIAEQESFTIYFSRVRWHEFAALPNCSADQIRNAYFALVDLGLTQRLSSFLASDSSSRKAYGSLRHFRIFLDETGCHEILAESARIGA
jgi:hypothetical protein